jgi:tetratricopeptide (TPR) repeat protein
VGGSTASACYDAAEARDATDEAFRECDSALAGILSEHDRVATYINRGILKLVRADYAQANADFDAAMAITPNQPEAWLNKGISLYQQGQPAAALPYFEGSIARRTSYQALAFYARGLANEDTGNIRAAYSDLRRAQALSPKWDAPKVELARYQVKQR